MKGNILNNATKGMATHNLENQTHFSVSTFLSTLAHFLLYVVALDKNRTDATEPRPLVSSFFFQ